MSTATRPSQSPGGPFGPAVAPPGGTLRAAGERFARRYNTRADLLAEQRGWSRTVAFVASDSREAITLRVEDGAIVDVSAVDAQALTGADVVVTADAATLHDVLELRREPNEPYLFGELTVRGPEADFLRLDYIAGAMWTPT